MDGRHRPGRACRFCNRGDKPRSDAGAHRQHDLDNLASRHLDLKMLTYAEVTGKGASQICFDQVPIERAAEYSAAGADVTLQVHGLLHERVVADADLAHVYESIELPTRE